MEDRLVPKIKIFIKNKVTNIQDDHIVKARVAAETRDITNYKTQEEIQVPKSENGNNENKDILISYANTEKDRMKKM